jgi:hypothetical protein
MEIERVKWDLMTDEENLDKYLTSQISKSASDKEMEIGKLIDEATGGYEHVSKNLRELRNKIKGLLNLILQEGVEYAEAKARADIAKKIFEEIDAIFIFYSIILNEKAKVGYENLKKDYEVD